MAKNKGTKMSLGEFMGPGTGSPVDALPKAPRERGYVDVALSSGVVGVSQFV